MGSEIDMLNATGDLGFALVLPRAYHDWCALHVICWRRGKPSCASPRDGKVVSYLTLTLWDGATTSQLYVIGSAAGGSTKMSCPEPVPAFDTWRRRAR